MEVEQAPCARVDAVEAAEVVAEGDEAVRADGRARVRRVAELITHRRACAGRRWDARRPLGRAGPAVQCERRRAWAGPDHAPVGQRGRAGGEIAAVGALAVERPAVLAGGRIERVQDPPLPAASTEPSTPSIGPGTAAPSRPRTRPAGGEPSPGVTHAGRQRDPPGRFAPRRYWPRTQPTRFPSCRITSHSPPNSSTLWQRTRPGASST